jgi:hypothetical protein
MLENQVEFSAEMLVHLDGIKNLDKPGVLLFPKILACLDCGFCQFKIRKSDLGLLDSDSPNGERVLMAAAG